MEGKNLSQPESLGQYEQQKKISSLLLSLKNKVSESLTDINLLCQKISTMNIISLNQYAIPFQCDEPSATMGLHHHISMIKYLIFK